MDDGLRLLQVVHTTGYGGLERQVLALSQGLQASGHQVVLALQPDSWLAQQADDLQLPWEPVRFLGLADPRSHWRLARIVRRHAIDVVHGHSRRSAYYSAMAGRWGRCGSVATVHSLNTWKGFAANQRVVAVSEAVRDGLLEHGLPAPAVVRVHNGVPAKAETTQEQRLQARQALGLDEDRLIVAMVGRMVEHKGHDLLLQALAKLGSDGADIDICLVGDDEGAWATALRQLADTLGLSSRLHMLGYRKDVEPVLRAADALVQPSRSEALSLSLLEAMAVGLPVVAARVGGMPEVIRHGDNGLLFASEQVDELADRLATLRSPLLRRRLGRRAHLTQRQRFSVATMVDETVSLYREVAGARA